jgi:hypothetical protein
MGPPGSCSIATIVLGKSGLSLHDSGPRKPGLAIPKLLLVHLECGVKRLFPNVSCARCDLGAYAKAHLGSKPPPVQVLRLRSRLGPNKAMLAVGA